MSSPGSSPRVFVAADFIQRSPHPDAEPIRSIITTSPEAVVVQWYLLPGQHIAPHIHPAGQDTWVIQAGQGDYVLARQDTGWQTTPIQAGHVVIAPVGQAHGVTNSGSEPLIFISVVAPETAGFEPLVPEVSG